MGDLLDQVLRFENLERAWNNVADNGGMPGVDDISIARFVWHWEERLVSLTHAVQRDRYEPKPLRQRRIPKRQRGEWRTLRIPTVADRVLQRGVYQVLSPLYEPLFLPCSFGYRPGLGLKQAVQRIIDLREGGDDWVVDADIDAFFDQVHHPTLLDLLGEQIHDADLLSLIETWLGQSQEPLRGIAMGSPLSPLLANVYLHPLDTHLTRNRWHVVRYADDFCIFAPTEQHAEQAYGIAQACLESLQLSYEPSKTRLTSFDEGFDFIGVHFEQQQYSYLWEEKRVEVAGNTVDWLFGQYGPHYD